MANPASGIRALRGPSIALPVRVLAPGDPRQPLRGVFGIAWKGCRPLLSALFLLVGSTASAAKISFSEKGYIDVGGLVQAQPDRAVPDRQVRAVTHRSQTITSMRRAIAPWCSRADLNAATSVGSPGLRPEFMPGTRIRLLS